MSAKEKIPFKTALFKAYKDAGTSQLRQKELKRIIAYAVQDPECSAAGALSMVAKKGDTKVAKAIEPLMSIFWEGDFEWQIAIIGLLGDIAHLAKAPLRVDVARFLGHVSVSDAFIGGSGVDSAAIDALVRIGANCADAFFAKFPKNKVIVFNGRETFSDELKKS